MLFKLVIFSVLIFHSLVISYQDAKRRLVSAGAILTYALTCCAYTYVQCGLTCLLENAASAGIYFLLCFSVLTLYYYIKEKKFLNIIDSKIGLADVLLILCIGSTMELPVQVLFFMLAFTCTALAALFFLKRDRTIPLAAFLVWQHVVFLIVLPFWYRGAN